MQQQTKIIATIGPASQDIKIMKKLIKAGVDAFRLNFSHGNYQSYEKIIKDIKKIREKMEVNLPIILDTKGPEIRTADIKGKIKLKKGDEIIFTIKDTTNPSDSMMSREKRATDGINANNNKTQHTNGKNRVSYDGLVKDTEIGEKIIIDSGLMSARVVKKTKTDVICKMLTGGILGSRRHLNLPGKDISLPSITEKDWADIEFGVKHNLDFCAMSFVRRASDIKKLQKFLHEKKSKMKIIAKIENKIAVKNLKEIIMESDGVMVARGDLGVELPYYKVPKIQRNIIRISAKYQKLVIVATEMLDSMIETPYPTRAEVADVSVAVFQQTDTTMLSGETASGEYPVESVKVMSEILRESEKNILARKKFRDLPVRNNYLAMAKTVAEFTFNRSDIKAVLVITKSGKTAENVASFRPKMKIYSFTDDPRVARQMNLLWGGEPYQIEFDNKRPEKTIENAQKKLLEEYPKFRGKKVILLSGVLVKNKFVISLQIREL